MVMLRQDGKAQKISEKVMRSKGMKVRKPKSQAPTKLTGPYLQH